MKKYISTAALSLLVALSAFGSDSCSLTNLDSVKSEKEFDQLLENASQPIAVQFHSGCAICNATRRHLSDIKSEYTNVTFVEVDIEKVPNVAERYNIAALPTVLIFVPWRKEPACMITGPNREKLASKINEVLLQK